jgi:hypothetical protein
MPEQPSVGASSSPKAISGFRRFGALAASIALHLVILYLLGGMSWTIPESERDRRTSVVWLQEWPLTVEESPEVLLDAELEEFDQAARLPETPGNPPEIDTIPQGPTTVPTPDEPSSDIPGPEPPHPPSDPLQVEEGPGDVTEGAKEERPLRNIDLAEARRQVMARMREEREREGSYHTFSSDDRIGERRDTAPAPATPIFEPWPPCPVVDRLAVQLVMTMAGVCFRTRAPRELFSHLTPDYMNQLPICEPVTDADGNETYKCRLVIETE